jgi:hypothetical protein
MKILQRMHRNFDPILCRFGSDSKRAKSLVVHPSVPDLVNERDHIMPLLHNNPTVLSTNQHSVLAVQSVKMAERVSEDVVVRRRTAPADCIRVLSTHLNDNEKLEKMYRRTTA